MQFVKPLLFSLILSAIATPAASAAEGEKPRLLVLIVFDQMRGDYLQRWQPLFGDRGFALLQKEGAWFTNCHYPHGVTTTGPGHASLLTGCTPDRHGIVNNEWYDVESGPIVNYALGRNVTSAFRFCRKNLPAPQWQPGKEPKKETP